MTILVDAVLLLREAYFAFKSIFVIPAALLVLITIGASLALGILILTRGDHLSLAFLVVSNLYPALLTFAVIYIRLLFYRDEIAHSPSTDANSDPSSNYFNDNWLNN